MFAVLMEKLLRREDLTSAEAAAFMADGYARAGLDYYPKLVVAAPFTPATGPRLLMAPGASADVAAEALNLALEAARAALRNQVQSQ